MRREANLDINERLFHVGMIGEARAGMDEGTMNELAARFASELNEPNVALLERIIGQMGADAAQELLEETKQIEADGGLFIKSGKRRRTPGGVYFFLARQRLSSRQREEVFSQPGWRRVWMGPGEPPAGVSFELRSQRHDEPIGEITSESWQLVRDVVRSLLKTNELGKATAVKIQLTGRPGKVAIRKHFVVTTMETHADPPSLHQGMPTPPKARLMYLVYIPRQVWVPISQQLQEHADDEMQIEGFLTYDSELKKLSIFVEQATTRQLQGAPSLKE